MRSWWRSLITRASRPSDAPDLDAEGRRVRVSRDRHAKLGDAQLKAAAHRSVTLPEFVGVAAVVASRVLGLHMFDVQIEGALASDPYPHGRVVVQDDRDGYPGIIADLKSFMTTRYASARQQLAEAP